VGIFSVCGTWIKGVALVFSGVSCKFSPHMKKERKKKY
jgi:hypothetical protein